LAKGKLDQPAAVWSQLKETGPSSCSIQILHAPRSSANLERALDCKISRPHAVDPRHFRPARACGPRERTATGRTGPTELFAAPASTGRGASRLSRLGGGIGTRRGPGANAARNRSAAGSMAPDQEAERSARGRLCRAAGEASSATSASRFPALATIAMVGYTNARKNRPWFQPSSPAAAVSGPIARMFATLDPPRFATVELPSRRKVAS